MLVTDSTQTDSKSALTEEPQSLAEGRVRKSILPLLPSELVNITAYAETKNAETRIALRPHGASDGQAS